MIFVLALYLAFLVAYAAYSLIAIYHLRRFGYVGDATGRAIVIYSTVSVAIILLSIIYILGTNWPAEFTL